MPATKPPYGLKGHQPTEPFYLSIITEDDDDTIDSDSSTQVLHATQKDALRYLKEELKEYENGTRVYVYRCVPKRVVISKSNIKVQKIRRPEVVPVSEFVKEV